MEKIINWIFKNEVQETMVRRYERVALIVFAVLIVMGILLWK